MKKLLVGVVVAAVAVVALRPTHKVTDGGSLVTDRIWIERMPHSDTDTIHALILSDDQAQGVFVEGSAWRSVADGFMFKLDRGVLHTIFPQTRQQETYNVDAKVCSVKGFEVCLEISGGTHGVEHYYSMKNWVIDSQASGTARLAKIMHP